MSKTKITTFIAMLFMGTQVMYGQFVEMSSGSGISEVIQCLDGHTCYLGGLQGSMRKTIDGTTWVDASNGIPSSADISLMQCFNKDTCYAYGSLAFYRTVDGGNNWTEILLSNNIWALDFINTQVGFGKISGQLYKSTNKGDTWTWINTLPVGIDGIYEFDFLDEQNGFITTSSSSGNTITIFKTTDGGQNWSNKFEKTATTIFVRDIQMVTPMVGYVCGNTGMIFKTSDGGENWTELNNPYKDQVLTYVALDFINSNSGYVVGTQGKIVKTIDGGQTWVDESVLTNANKDVAVTSLDTVYIAMSASGLVMKNVNSNLALKVNDLSAEIGKIYPNPTKNQLTIELKQNQANTKLLVYDLLGKPLSEYQLTEKVNTITNLNLINGIYLFQVIQDAEIISNGTLIIN